MTKPKYIVTHDPVSYTGKGSYIVKVNNAALTPVCVVFVPLGLCGQSLEECEDKAKKEAERISAALDLYDKDVLKDLREYLLKIKLYGFFYALNIISDDYIQLHVFPRVDNPIKNRQSFSNETSLDRDSVLKLLNDLRSYINSK